MHSNAAENRNDSVRLSLPTRHGRKTISPASRYPSLNRIHQPRPHLRRQRQPVHQHIDRPRKIQFQQRLRRRELYNLAPVLIQPVVPPPAQLQPAAPSTPRSTLNPPPHSLSFACLLRLAPASPITGSEAPPLSTGATIASSFTRAANRKQRIPPRPLRHRQHGFARPHPPFPPHHAAAMQACTVPQRAYSSRR